MISCSSSRSSSSTVVPSVTRIVPGLNWTVVVVVAVTTWRIPASSAASTSTSAATTTPCRTARSTSPITKVGTTTIFIILFVFLFLSTLPYKKKCFCKIKKYFPIYIVLLIKIRRLLLKKC